MSITAQIAAYFDEPTTTIRILLILGIVACIAALKLTA